MIDLDLACASDFVGALKMLLPQTMLYSVGL